MMSTQATRKDSLDIVYLTFEEQHQLFTPKHAEDDL